MVAVKVSKSLPIENFLGGWYCVYCNLYMVGSL